MILPWDCTSIPATHMSGSFSSPISRLFEQLGNMLDCYEICNIQEKKFSGVLKSSCDLISDLSASETLPVNVDPCIVMRYHPQLE